MEETSSSISMGFITIKETKFLFSSHGFYHHRKKYISLLFSLHRFNHRERETMSLLSLFPPLFPRVQPPWKKNKFTHPLPSLSLISLHEFTTIKRNFFSLLWFNHHGRKIISFLFSLHAWVQHHERKQIPLSSLLSQPQWKKCYTQPWCH